MNLFRMAGSYLDPYQPSFLILFVTSRCNASCEFCFYAREVEDTRRKVQELSTDEMISISRNCGVIPYLLISGGEPVLRDDLFTVISAFIENAHSQFITIPSNGLNPRRSYDLFSKLTAKYPGSHFRAALSVDYSDHRHDNLRGVQGCLEIIQNTAERIRSLRRNRNNLTLDVVTVYTNDPDQDHCEIRKWVEEKIAPDNHELHVLRPEWPDLIVDGLNVQDFLKNIAIYRNNSDRKKESRPFSSFFRALNGLYIKNIQNIIDRNRISPCKAGRKITVIDDTGKVKLCEYRNEILGDLRSSDYSLKKILKDSRKRLKSKDITCCSCTWECAVSCNIVTDVTLFPALSAQILKNIFMRKTDSK
ncbi:hypothetical protein CSA37_01950 [Candidatus Fermentibacteria bacterium]|nr:MAG: hypothetical protein CSA37_01950 [Candidatus Fermentibacteria bacterium]